MEEGRKREETVTLWWWEAVIIIMVCGHGSWLRSRVYGLKDEEETFVLRILKGYTEKGKTLKNNNKTPQKNTTLLFWDHLLSEIGFESM